jgi:hypothetical protein
MSSGRAFLLSLLLIFPSPTFSTSPSEAFLSINPEDYVLVIDCPAEPIPTAPVSDVLSSSLPIAVRTFTRIIQRFCRTNPYLAPFVDADEQELNSSVSTRDEDSLDLVNVDIVNRSSFSSLSDLTVTEQTIRRVVPAMAMRATNFTLDVCFACVEGIAAHIPAHVMAPHHRRQLLSNMKPIIRRILPVLVQLLTQVAVNSCVAQAGSVACFLGPLLQDPDIQALIASSIRPALIETARPSLRRIESSSPATRRRSGTF